MNQPPGFYWADGDPPGTTRYWDGTTWQGGPVIAPDGPGSAAGTHGNSHSGGAYPEASQANKALMLTLMSIVLCQFLAPVGWIIAHHEIQAIKTGRRDPINKRQAEVARIVGILMTILLSVVGVYVLLTRILEVW